MNGPGRPSPLLVAYDVFDDARRDRVRNALAPMAFWYQRSLWVLPGPRPTLDALAEGLGWLVERSDKLLLTVPCGPCQRGALWAPAPDVPWPTVAPVT